MITKGFLKTNKLEDGQIQTVFTVVDIDAENAPRKFTGATVEVSGKNYTVQTFDVDELNFKELGEELDSPFTNLIYIFITLNYAFAERPIDKTDFVM